MRSRVCECHSCSIQGLLWRSGRSVKPQEGGQSPDTLGEEGCLKKGLEALITQG